ncbi:MAG: glutamate-5-semialdehyde dehydrogenase [Verrucomicrobia bacterium]|nr:glutamate-5-semialdehyde dehydrogenase [Verrucomicrobiota bacterium]
MTLKEDIQRLGKQARVAAHRLATLTTDQKNQCLQAMAEGLLKASDIIQKANEQDLGVGRTAGLSAAMLDRLALNDKRISAMAAGLREVAALPDPVGRVLEDRTRPNGLRLQKVAVPIGVIAFIYESRPNVTADAAGLCLKAGNAVILRGGKEAIQSNRAIANVLLDSGAGAGLPANAVQLVQTTDREAVRELVQLTGLVDVVIPRGGEALIRAVTENARVPVIKHYKGVCHVYVDRDADLDMAERIVLNAKCQRPAVCNAMETLLVDEAVAKTFLPRIANALLAKKVELRGDDATRELIAAAKAATEADWSTEYGDLIINIRVVADVDAAIAHINHYGSQHSDAIVTRDRAAADRFLREVDSAAVYHNASTRFTDGGEFGMGAEVGISTDKIGVRGPMGLEELTAYKWIVEGTGQVRE